MGLAAAQARLLSITSRMSDNELRAQLINNKKIRLSNESARASEKYLNALNNAKLMFRNYDGENVEANQQLTFNALTTYGPYNTQYGLINSNGQMLVSEEMANIFEASGGDLEKFLKSYGLEKTSHFFEGIIDNYGYDETVQNVMNSLGIEMSDTEAAAKLEEAYGNYLQTIASKNYQAVELNINNTIDELKNWDSTVVYPGLDEFYSDMYDTMAAKETYSDVAAQYVSLYNSLNATNEISYTYKNNAIKFMKSILAVDDTNAYTNALKNIPKYNEGEYEFDDNVYALNADNELVAGTLQSGSSTDCTIAHEHVDISDDESCYEIAEYGYTEFGQLGDPTTDIDNPVLVDGSASRIYPFKFANDEISYTYTPADIHNYNLPGFTGDSNNKSSDFVNVGAGLGQSGTESYTSDFVYTSSATSELPKFQISIKFRGINRWETTEGVSQCQINSIKYYDTDSSSWKTINSNQYSITPDASVGSNTSVAGGGQFGISLNGVFSDTAKSSNGSDSIKLTINTTTYKQSEVGLGYYYAGAPSGVTFKSHSIQEPSAYYRISYLNDPLIKDVNGITINLSNYTADATYNFIEQMANGTATTWPNLLVNANDGPVLYRKVKYSEDGVEKYKLSFYGLKAGKSNGVDAYTKTLIWEGTPEEYEEMIVEQIKNNYFATLNEFITRAINDTDLINYDEENIAKILKPYLFEDSDSSTNYELSNFFKRPSGDSSTTGYINEYFERINGVWKFKADFTDDSIFTGDGKEIAQAFLLNDLFNKFGDPTWSWVDTADKNYGDADAKVQWYTNIFNRMKNEGYQVLLDGLAASTQWIENALESGLVTMTQIDSENNWKNIGYANCADITEQTDDYAVTLAEAEYKLAMQKIQAKDQRFDMELKNIDTEHSALQNEMDSIKTAMSKHIERSFKYFG